MNLTAQSSPVILDLSVATDNTNMSLDVPNIVEAYSATIGQSVKLIDVQRLSHRENECHHLFPWRLSGRGKH